MPERLSNRRHRAIARLSRRKHRRQHGEALIEGVRAVEAALDAGAPLVEVVVSEDAQNDRRIAALLRRVGVTVYVAEADAFNTLSDVETPQGVLAVVRTALVSPERLTETRAVLALDGVQDPGNVGTVLRTAAWFGADAVLGGPGTASFFGPKVLRAAMGGHWDLALARTEDLAGALQRLRAAGVACYGADRTGTPAASWQPRRPSALVLGSEAHGLSAGVLDLVEARVALPGAFQPGGAPKATESLNVAVAGGILVYEWLGDPRTARRQGLK